MFKYIIWDFDGTLHDTYPGMIQAFHKALKDYDVHEDIDNVFKQVKLSVGHALKYFSEKYSLDEKTLRDKYVQQGKKLHPDIMGPYPYAREICARFKEMGGRNFIYTHRNDVAIEYLKHHDMLDCFEDVITSVHGFVKPNPDGFLHIMEKYNLRKEDGIGIGDRDLDIIAAEQAGLKTCLIKNDGLPYKSNPDFVIGSLKELKGILGIE